ncbi:hypothetical protein B0J12DRAFT_547648, partial [Macrophomina phaseolina]
PGSLPTCHQHRDQLLRPGICQYMVDPKSGARCKRLFHFDPPPPHLELCPDHVDTPQGPCFFLRLPVELRMEIFKYLLPAGLTVTSPPVGSRALQRINEFFPLLLTSKQIGAEARDYLYGSTTFHLELSQKGATIGDRYLYRPRGAEERGDPERGIVKDLDLRQQLDFSCVKNYNLEIIVQNANHLDGWSEEVEMYDLRDSVSAILPYLARARHLHRLIVRVVFCRFDCWTPSQALENMKLITQPLTTALRNTTTPILEPPWKGSGNTYINCSSAADVPPPWKTQLFGPLVPTTDPHFLTYQTFFQNAVASALAVPPKSPIARMFSTFKNVYLEGAAHMRHVLPSGAANYLHRARVARESADADAFFAARNDYVKQWNTHLEASYSELARVNALVFGMFGEDVVTSAPSPWDAAASVAARSVATS